MSDWYKGDRDPDGRYGPANRNRREFGGQDRGRRRDRRFDEDRSFEASEDQARGEPYAGRGEPDQDYGRTDRGEAWRGDPGRREVARGEPYDQRYGREGRGQQDWGHSPYADRRGWRGRDDDARERGGVVGMNEALRRVSDGGADSVDRDEEDMRRFRMGEHRGRGPKNYVRSDDRIREDVSDRLSDDSWLDASDIEVTVASCEVTLSGLVRTRDDKRRAEDIAERVGGVRHVQNNLRVHPPREFPAVT